MKRFFLRGAVWAIVATLFSGCADIAMMEDVSWIKKEIDTKIVALQIEQESRVQGIETKIGRMEEKIDAQQAGILQLREDLHSQIKETRIALDENNFLLTKRVEEVAKQSDEREYELKKEIENLKKSSYELLASLSAINTSILSLNSEVVNLKSSRSEELALGFAEIREEFSKKLKLLLDEVVRQESELHSVKNAVAVMHPVEENLSEIVISETSPEPSEEKRTILKKEPEQRVHIVRQGDTLIQIARQYRVSLDSLKKVNNLGKDDTIYAGRRLLIP
ncbi:MAG: LysM domain-containing protein [Candidatus Ratteibacteria bacterium]|jgi:LysM repeat protein